MDFPNNQDADTPRFESQRKPKSCPSCSNPTIGTILFGMRSPEDWAQLKEQGYVGGGCVITGDDPKWRCTSCGIEIHRT